MFKSSSPLANWLLNTVLLACSVKAIQFECTFEMRSPWTPMGNRYTCYATVINSGPASLESVTGVHQEGKSDEDVEYLLIFRQELPFVPEGIADIFKNLDSLLIQRTSLNSLRAKDLRPFPRLMLINLVQSQLTSIDGDLFAYTPHLRYVDFSSNQIEFIEQDLVTSLNDLEYLGFLYNVCINQTATNRAEVLSLASELSLMCPESRFTSPTIPECTCQANPENRSLKLRNQATLTVKGSIGSRKHFVRGKIAEN